jgi:hypothetical protein
MIPVWRRALTQPNEATYAEIAASPNAKAQTALLWVFIASTLSGLVSAVLAALLGAAGFQQAPIPGMEQFENIPMGGASLLSGLCAAPIFGLISTVGFAILAALVQWVARLFGGVGTFDKMAYTLASITVPFTLVFTILGSLSVVPYVGVCSGLLSLAAVIYILVLEVMAVKGVNGFGWGQAIASLFLPALGIAFICGCLIALASMALLPLLSEMTPNLAP